MNDRAIGWMGVIWLATAPLLGGCVAGGPDDEAEDTAAAEEAASSRPLMRIPFPCGQVWSAQTRADHNPWQAVDWNRANDFGDTVVASASGTVTRVENEGNTSYGRWVEIGHGNGWRTRYAHLSVQSVHVGQHVKMGQKIGEVGSTGGSTGPHLHYEQLLNGSPMKIVLGHTAVKYFATHDYESHNGC